MSYNIPQVELGRTGLMVTRLGIGGAYCKTPDGYIKALDCGVNYIDTARSYEEGNDEKEGGQEPGGRNDGANWDTRCQFERQTL